MTKVNEEGNVSEEAGHSKDSINPLLDEAEKELNVNGKVEELCEPEIRSMKGIFEGFEVPESLYFGEPMSPMNKIVELVLLEAIRSRASDIYFELSDKKVKVRYNIDDVLCEVLGPPTQLYRDFMENLEARFGIWGIEKKKAKKWFKKIEKEEVVKLHKFDDGDFVQATIKFRGKKLGLNLMKIASSYRDVHRLKLFNYPDIFEDITSFFGYDNEKVKKIENMFEKEKGIILVSGLPNSGRTTTIYNLFVQINRLDKINVAIGRTFVPGGVIQFLAGPSNQDYTKELKAIRKLNPKVVSIDDVADNETAKEIEYYANSGALVFASVPSADAIKGIEYLTHLGINTKLLVENLRGVIGQRLVRKVCEECKEVYGVNEVSKKIREVKLAEVEHEKFLKVSYGKGCDNCRQTGYYGMVPIFQVIGSEDKEMEIIKQRLKEGREIKQMEPSLYRLVRAKVLEGKTTIEELSKI